MTMDIDEGGSAALLIPGYSPHVRDEIDAFFADTAEELADPGLGTGRFSPSVAAFADLLRRDPIIRMYALDMFGQVPEQHRVVSDVPELLRALQLLSTRAPEYNADPARANFFPASTLFVHMMNTPAGQVLFRNHAFNDGIRAILKSWCVYLDSPESRSVLNTGENGWLCDSSYERHNLGEYLVPDSADPHWGFTSFNDFFHRQIRPECRPVAEPDNPNVIVAPNDGTLYKVAHGATSLDRFWVKSQPYSLLHLLACDDLATSFEGGTVFQSFLDGRNYHRFWSPVAGTVRKIETIEGLMFSGIDSITGDLTAGTYSQAYMSCVNTRTLIFVESDDPGIGLVCLVAVGISEVSSISTCVEVGGHVAKGGELGHFSYGGSSVCVIFQPGAIREFTIDTSNTGTQVGVRGLELRAGQEIAVR
jgi:phosphatidylserine decarboxylase